MREGVGERSEEKSERKTGERPKNGIPKPACTPASQTPLGTKAHPSLWPALPPAPLPRGRPQGCCFTCGGRRPATASRTSSGTWEDGGPSGPRSREAGPRSGGAQLGSPRERGAAEAVLGVWCFPALSGAAGLPAQGSPGNLSPPAPRHRRKDKARVPIQPRAKPGHS